MSEWKYFFNDAQVTEEEYKELMSGSKVDVPAMINWYCGNASASNSILGNIRFTSCFLLPGNKAIIGLSFN